MKKIPKLVRERRGLTGLETAIIVMAFVIVAAAFAFAVLNMGFQTSQRSTEVMQSGLQEASSAIELDGAVIAYGGDAGNDGHADYVVNYTFCIKLSAGKHPVDLSPNTLVLTYTDPYTHKYDVYNSSKVFAKSEYNTAMQCLRNGTAAAIICEVRGDGDSMLEYGEKFLVAINITTVYGGNNPPLKPNDQVIVEVKPPVGAILTVVRRLPPALDMVMNLG